MFLNLSFLLISIVSLGSEVVKSINIEFFLIFLFSIKDDISLLDGTANKIKSDVFKISSEGFPQGVSILINSLFS